MKATAADLSSHTTSTSNPHGVTAAQVGLGNVDNTSDANKPVSTATLTALTLKADASDLATHIGNTNNPHSVTATHLGLENVNNTSDANKPISTATQAALDAKLTAPSWVADRVMFHGASGLSDSSSFTFNDASNSLNILGGVNSSTGLAKLNLLIEGDSDPLISMVGYSHTTDVALLFNMHLNGGSYVASHTTGFGWSHFSDRLRLVYAHGQTKGTAINQDGVAWPNILDGTSFDAFGRQFIGNSVGTAKLNVKGSGSTSSTSSLFIENSSGTNLINLTDDGQLKLNTKSIQTGLTSGQKHFSILFANGTADQKVDLFFPASAVFSGEFEVKISGQWNWANAIGSIAKKFYTGFNGASFYVNSSVYTEAGGETKNFFAISDLRWDAINSRWYVTIISRSSAGNQINVKVSANAGWGIENFMAMEAGTVYTTDPTTFEVVIGDRLKGYVKKTASYTITNEDPEMIYANSGSAITFTLPNSPVDGAIFTIKNIAAGVLTVARNGQQINRTTNDLTVNANEKIRLQFLTGTGWETID